MEVNYITKRFFQVPRQKKTKKWPKIKNISFLNLYFQGMGYSDADRPKHYALFCIALFFHQFA